MTEQSGPADGPAGGVDPAVRAARAVVGLYGDPDITWSILLELDLTEPLDAALLVSRLERACADFPHLGRAPDVAAYDESARAAFADTAYGDRDPLVRVALDASGRTLLLAAHHGAVDGLGLVGLAGLLLERPLGTNARGVRRTGAEPGFVRGSLRRLGEALVRPPERFHGHRRAGSGDHLGATGAAGTGTAGLVWVATRALATWNGAPTRGRRPVVAIGVSRRAGTAPLRPDRDTAYTRLPVGGAGTREAVGVLLGQAEPEPDFPESDGGGIGPVVTRLLASRLGASVLVSNLGVIADPALAGARFWPTASGPCGVGLGMVTAGGRTSLTVRARRAWFSGEDAVRLLAVVSAEAQ